MASSSSYSTSNSPCAACKFLRRKCMPDCIFAAYFPAEEPQKFAHVHKIFGASNVSKLLNEVAPHQREDAVNSLAYEAEARLKDPVYGCVGAISLLQRQVVRLQKELDATNAHLLRYANNNNHNVNIVSHHQPLQGSNGGNNNSSSSSYYGHMFVSGNNGGYGSQSQSQSSVGGYYFGWGDDDERSSSGGGGNV